MGRRKGQCVRTGQRKKQCVRERDIERGSYVDMCHTLYIESLHRERDIERDRRELCENGTVCEKGRETDSV